MPTPFDWTPIFGIEFQFMSASNPSAAASLNKAYSEIIGTDELSEFFVTRKEEGPLEIAPDPQIHILNCIAKAIAINLIDPDEVTKGHISTFSQCVIKHVRNNGSRKRKRYTTEFDAAAKHAIRTNTDEEPIVLFELTITHWRFKNKWRPDLFMQAYTGDPSSATAPRARFANLPRRKHIKPKSVPLQRKPVASEAHMAIQFPAQANNSIIDTPAPTDLLPTTYTSTSSIVNTIVPSPYKAIPCDTTKIVDSNAAATPVEALSETPATFQRTFNPHSRSVAFHHLPTPVSLPKSPGASSLQPLWSKVSHTDSHVLLPHTNPTVLRITKRHRDALKIKLFHLHANILSMNWFYDTID
eukprot:jgi/Psemu1/55357/gm1.55357_g